MLLESLPLLDPYTWQKRETYDGLGLPIVHVFIDEKSSSAETDTATFEKLAKEHRGKLAFVKFNKADDYMLKVKFVFRSSAQLSAHALEPGLWAARETAGCWNRPQLLVQQVCACACAMTKRRIRSDAMASRPHGTALSDLCRYPRAHKNTRLLD
jgi:hypothetical protein